jgi:RNA polymerase-interacting CarD/CdnL/TRCF family regulator
MADYYQILGVSKGATAEEIKKVYKDLKNKIIETEYNTLLAKEMIFSNNLDGIVSVLIYYWISIETLTKADREMIEQIMARLCQEISMVTKKDALAVRKEIESILKKRN